MLFTIDSSVSKVASHVAVAVVRIRLAPTATADFATLDRLKAESLNALRDAVPSRANADLEKVATIAQWMQTYKAMGLKPKKVKPTHYALSSRLLKDEKWPRAIGPLVDAYLTNQIKHLMPHGGYDVTSLTGGTIELLKSPTPKKFQPLGVASHEAERIETTLEDETLYQDVPPGGSDAVVLTRHWNYRDAEPTKIVDDHDDESKSTKEFVLFIESVDGSPEGRAKLEATAKDLEEVYRMVFGRDNVLQSYVRVLELGPESEGCVSMSLDW